MDPDKYGHIRISDGNSQSRIDNLPLLQTVTTHRLNYLLLSLKYKKKNNDSRIYN